jgi:dihydroxyacetone kinase phosphoprotein-dependent L subunit
VGIVVGGGSGHEPAFAGYVGKGLADAAVIGNVFASPSPAHILEAASAVDGGAGILFLYGNYTGDVMNFSMAEEDLKKLGVTARSVVTTDDVMSAPSNKIHERRGIAGNFFVFKVAGAAADLGASLDLVEFAARRANGATRTMGVALSACSMPQTGKYNFSISDNEMEVGMGIHGEPGVARMPVESADAVADRLLQPILHELVLKAGDKVAVLINSLGATTLLELYILSRRVLQTLTTLGIHIHRTWVGEYCTSLDMSGASISIMKLDDELTSYLDHPCNSSALRIGNVDSIRSVMTFRAANAVSPDIPSASQSLLNSDGPITLTVFREMMMASSEAIYANQDLLCELDGALGDGDHGVTMRIGWKAAIDAMRAANDSSTIAELSRLMGRAFLNAVGASVGPLYATGFATAGDAVAHRLNLDSNSLVDWLGGLAHGIALKGGASKGDKTMLDAWEPAVEAATKSLVMGGSVGACMSAAANAANRGANSTASMQSNRGRSKKLGLRSVGHRDPGAASAALIIAAWSNALASL